MGPDPKTGPEQPPGFIFVPLTSEQSQAWSQEFKAAKKTSTKADWRQIGNVRNGFGMVMSHVYALNDPGAWPADTLKMDLESQGAKVVDASQSGTADISRHPGGRAGLHSTFSPPPPMLARCPSGSS